MGVKLPFKDWHEAIRLAGEETETTRDLEQVFSVTLKMPMTNKLIKKQYMRKAVLKSLTKKMAKKRQQIIVEGLGEKSKKPRISMIRG